MPRGGGKEQSRRAGGASAPGGPRRAAPARLRPRDEGGSSPDVVPAGAPLGRPVAMNGTDVAELLGVFALIVLTGFFAMSETAITRTGRARAYRLVEEERRGAVSLLRIVENVTPYLNVVLLLTL